MQRIGELKEAIEGIAAACGNLHERYDEPEALELMRALGKHCPATERVLMGAPATLQQARADLHIACLTVEHAIRLAIAQPDRAEHQQSVVDRVSRLRPFAETARQTFARER